jgi:hypothetical protein
LAIALTKRSVQAGWIVATGGGLVDVEQHLGFRLGDGDAAVAAGAVEDAAQQIDVGSDTMPGSSFLPERRGPGAVEHRVPDLLEGEADEALRRPARLVQHVDQQLQLRLGVDPAVLADALDEPLRVLGGEVAPAARPARRGSR